MFISGTDCHGTPITQRAKKLGIKPQEIANKYHEEFKEVFSKFLADRELLLTCPKCHEETKGDQCDCAYIPTKEDLKEAVCVECGAKVITKENKNLYLLLSKLQDKIEKYVEEK